MNILSLKIVGIEKDDTKVYYSSEEYEFLHYKFEKCLYEKYITKSNWIKKVISKYNYNGFRTIIFITDNNYKLIFEVQE